MSTSLDRLKQRDEQHRQQEPETSEAMLTTLTSILDLVEAQRRQIALLGERQKKLADFVKVMDEQQTKQIEGSEQRLRTSITQASAPVHGDCATSATVENRLAEIEQTLTVLSGAIDAEKLTAAVSNLTSATSRVERTTTWNASQAAEFADKYRKALNAAGRAIYTTRDQAVASIEKASSAAAGEVSAHLDAAHERLRTSTERAAHMVTVAERLRKPLGRAAAAQMALMLLPVAVIVLMAVQTVWVGVVGIRWVLAQDWPTWQNITAGLALTSVVLGAGFGLWRLAVWVKTRLEESKI